MHEDFVGSRNNIRKWRDEEDIEDNRMKIEIVMRKKMIIEKYQKDQFSSNNP